VDYRQNNSRTNPFSNKDRCMEAVGFDTGQPLIVTVDKGKMVIETEF